MDCTVDVRVCVDVCVCVVIGENMVFRSVCKVVWHELWGLMRGSSAATLPPPPTLLTLHTLHKDVFVSGLQNQRFGAQFPQ